jgi:hypothetical protein
MAICHQGCTYDTVVVLNGPHCGTIWNIDEALSPPLRTPYSGFLNDYEDWVNRLFAKEKQCWYEYPRTQNSQEQKFILGIRFPGRRKQS